MKKQKKKRIGLLLEVTANKKVFLGFICAKLRFSILYQK